MRYPVLVLAVAALSAAALPAGAATVWAHASAVGSTTVVLSSPQPSALTALARSSALSSATRRQRLSSVLPTTDQRDRVGDELRSRGLTVVSQTPWSITARGPRAATQGLAAELGSDASSVLDDSGTTALVHPLIGPITGDTMRSVYSATGSPAVGSNPNLTVATLQFSGWDKSALTAYASDQSLPDPVASGKYSEVSVSGASTSSPDGTGGDTEVALDQESILAGAPNVDQRAYFAPNTAEGFVLGIEQVAADAAAHHIAALSISWGLCEPGWTSSEIAGVHTALSHVAAAGVTTFVATGDDGSQDCSFVGYPTVDYPSSDPYSVGVGGSTLSSYTPVAEAGWSGSGGGASRVFARPAYQHAVAGPAATRQLPDIASLAGSPGFRIRVGANGASIGVVGGTSLAAPTSAALFTGALQTRGHTAGVGDIHTRLYDATSTDFRDITSGNNGYAAGTGYDNVTGLGAPLWDALTASVDTAPTLSTAAYSHTRSVPATVTVPPGATYVGWRTGSGTPPSCTGATTTTTKPTTITATHDGATLVWVQGVTDAAACYTATALVTIDTVRPTSSATVALTKASVPGKLTVGWKVADTGSSGLKTAAITVTRIGSTTPVAVLHATASGSHVIAAVQGATYLASVVATDRAGNLSKAGVARASVPLDDSHFTRHGTWTRHASASAYGGAWRGAAKKKASASITARGRTFSLLVTKCKTCGKAAIYLDGKRVRTVDLYAGHTTYRVLVSVGARATGKHTVRVVNLGTHRKAAKGSTVTIDGLVAGM